MIEPNGKSAIALGATVLLAGAAAAMPAFGDWTAPINVETLAGSSQNLNTALVDGCASLSPDGLTLGFVSNRTGDFDIYLAERASPAEGFGDPVRLPAPVNGPGIDSCPTLLHGKRMIFTSFRDDPAGDLYATRSGPKGWAAPVRFGPNVNQPGIQDEVATVYEDDDGREIMIWSRRNAGQPGDIFQSIDGGPATLVQGGVNSSAADNRPSVTHDGKAIFWDSTRGSGAGDPDIWTATRSSTGEPWGTAERLATLSAIGFLDQRPSISWDGRTLILSSARPGGSSPAPDMWIASRDR